MQGSDRGNLSFFTGIFQKVLRKTTKNSSQDSRFPGRDLNLELSEHKTENKRSEYKYPNHPVSED